MADSNGNSVSDERSYSEAATRLLNHGPVTTYEPDEWFNYVEHYQLGEMEVIELINIAAGTGVDWSDANQKEAPVHAVRALGQLGDSAADHFIVTLLDHVEYKTLTDSVLVALAMMGPRSLKALEHYFDFPDTSIGGQIVAADGFSIFAQYHPQHRDQCVQFLTQMLAEYETQEPGANASLVANLVKLRATESLGVIEQAFQQGWVEVGICDSWANIQIEFGLATAADFTEAELLGYEPTVHRTANDLPTTASNEQPPGHRRLSEIALAGSYSMSEHLRRQGDQRLKIHH